jgi:alpha-galactosidase
MDSKKRIYAYNGTVIYRFSSDLLTKEEFPVKGSLSGYREEAMVIREMPNWVQIYSFQQQDLIGMRLPL